MTGTQPRWGTPEMLDGIESVLRNPSLRELQMEMLARASRPVLEQLCRRFGLPASGNMTTLRRRLLNATATLNRDAIARSAFYGVNGYDAVSDHINAVLGGEVNGIWQPATNNDLADAIRVIEQTPDEDLRLIIPGDDCSAVTDALTLLFVWRGRQYAEVSAGGTIVYRTKTSGFRFYCTAAAWPNSPAMREMRQHYHTLTN
ncbi:SAP domain-containing protein [Chloroflexus sp.]|uniref:SAP domain-containing protein n=1 Tax=Chloroflexus sp. TaxID=1904827 RepID=UPI002ACE0617|nr:SAP domain-containing protein [Chloroflexus sp.]